MTLSCSSDSSSDGSLSDTPNAKAKYDSSNYGIYKGFFVGSTGTVIVNINNEGALSATLTVDGSTKTYTTTETVTEGNDIEGLTFTNGSSSFDFSVSATGDDPSIGNINISGHADANMNVAKELSTNQVKCYEGSFNGDSSRTLNIITIGSNLYGLAKAPDDDSIPLIGTLSGNNISGIFPDGGTFVGTLSGNHVSGTWHSSSPSHSGNWSGNWSGNREL